MICKYSTDVIHQKQSVADDLNAGNNNANTINNNRNNNNTTSTNSRVQRKENRLTNNGTFSSHNHQLETAWLQEEVRVREQINIY